MVAKVIKYYVGYKDIIEDSDDKESVIFDSNILTS